MAEGFLPGRRRVLLVIGMVDSQRGVDVDVQPPAGCWVGSGGPRPRAGRRTSSTHPRQMRRINTLVDQPPHRGRRRLLPEDVLAIPTQLPDPIDTVHAIGHRRRQVGEHHPRRIHPRTLVRVGQRGRDLRRQPGQLGQLAQQAHPRMRHHAMTVRRYFHPRRRDTLHLQSASPVCADRTLDKSILHCGTGTFAYQHPPPTNSHEKFRLVSISLPCRRSAPSS
jgi:hypothetical protein